MPTRQQLESALRNSDAAGDTRAAKALANALKAGQFYQVVAQQPSDIAFPPFDPEDIPQVDESGNPIPTEYDNTKPRAIGERIIGAGEAALTTGTGAVLGTIGNIIGTGRGIADIVASGEFGTPEGAEKAAKTAEKYTQAMTYAPRTEAGKEYTENIGEALGATVGALPPTVSTAFQTPFRRLSPTKQKIASLVEQNSDDVQRAGFTTKPVVGGVAPVKDAAAKEAIRQGMDEGTVSLIQSSSKADKSVMREAIDTLKKAKKSKSFAIANRPGDAAGKALERRYREVEKINKVAGSEIEKAAKDLQGRSVDLAPVYDKFLETLQDSGVSIFRDSKGKLKGRYDNSEFAQARGTQRLLNDFIAKSERVSMDALDAHRLKRVIDSTVEYGKKKTSDPIVSRAESALKDLRSGINGRLQELSPAYRDANTKFADTRQAMDAFKDAAGSSFNPLSENASKQLVNTTRSLMSNNQKRVPAMDAINSLEQIAKKYGVKFEDDILKQAAFMDDLETIFGSSAPTSFGGQIEKSVGRAVRGDRAGIVADIAEAGIKKVRGVNEESLIKAIEELLK